MDEVLSDEQIANRCWDILSNIDHAKASYLARNKFDGEKCHVKWDNQQRKDVIKPVSTSKISQVLRNSERFKPVGGAGESMATVWRKVEEYVEEVDECE